MVLVAGVSSGWNNRLWHPLKLTVTTKQEAYFSFPSRWTLSRLRGFIGTKCDKSFDFLRMIII